MKTICQSFSTQSVVHSRDEKIVTEYADTSVVRIVCREIDTLCEFIVRAPLGSTFTCSSYFKDITTKPPPKNIKKHRNAEQLIDFLRKKFFDGLNEEGKKKRKAEILKKQAEKKKSRGRSPLQQKKLGGCTESPENASPKLKTAFNQPAGFDSRKQQIVEELIIAFCRKQFCFLEKIRSKARKKEE